MAPRVRIAFEDGLVRLGIDRLLPMRQVKPEFHKTLRFRQIVASIREVGIIEPIVVHPVSAKAKDYLVLDGHLRLEALKELGATEALCIVSKDDEAFTYNNKVNRLTAIQGHFMILKALEQGVGEDRIAKTLQVDVAKIRRDRDLLNGICPEAVSLLKDHPVVAATLQILKNVKPLRQIEMSEMMIVANNYSAPYARALLGATAQDQLVNPGPAQVAKGLRPEDAARIDKEMKMLGRQIKLIEQNYGLNMLNLAVIVGYLENILKNVRVVEYLKSTHPDLLTQLEKAAAQKA